jgi:phosphotransferase system  glucose/maltose/N-acetylglucosamine-specific IIC component
MVAVPAVAVATTTVFSNLRHVQAGHTLSRGAFTTFAYSASRRESSLSLMVAVAVAAVAVAVVAVVLLLLLLLLFSNRCGGSFKTELAWASKACTLV